MSTLSVEDRALRMLAAGDSPIDISTATGLSRDEIAKLQRDFPGTRTQQPRPAAVPHAAAEETRRADKAAKDKARADIARLEQQLAAAKAQLRGKSASSKTGGYLCGKGCGKVLNSPQGLGNHNKHCTGASATS